MAGAKLAESTDCPLASAIAQRLRDERDSLVENWLNRIAERVNISRDEVFPTDELLDHVPLLIGGIADYLEDPADEITADVPVVAKAMELGALRHEQGFDAHQILKEYEILGGVLFDFMIRLVDQIDCGLLSQRIAGLRTPALPRDRRDPAAHHRPLPETCRDQGAGTGGAASELQSHRFA